ncbi:MAG: class I SAM-dependent methyltransferase [Acidimicrobiales bacterium]
MPACSVATVRALPFPHGVFDAVWTIGVLMHVPDTAISGALDEVLRVLARGDCRLRLPGSRRTPDLRRGPGSGASGPTIRWAWVAAGDRDGIVHPAGGRCAATTAEPTIAAPVVPRPCGR